MKNQSTPLANIGRLLEILQRLKKPYNELLPGDGRSSITNGEIARPNRSCQRGKFPTRKASEPACQLGRRWIESEEFNEAAPMGFRRAVLVLLPFLDCRVGNSKSQQFRKLRHGQLLSAAIDKHKPGPHE